ncbi:putative zinc-induced protein [Oryza sativa Japonica Group]|uniref:Zinc-induced protein n=1 Tax=Oryza sativa subsp. japonica TaxID=39947 RepID=Q656I4_ORYSJ|nr:putative zinc-induced protein [Oryza sativa Japonica Group]
MERVASSCLSLLAQRLALHAFKLSMKSGLLGGGGRGEGSRPEGGREEGTTGRPAAQRRWTRRSCAPSCSPTPRGWLPTETDRRRIGRSRLAMYSALRCALPS